MLGNHVDPHFHRLEDPEQGAKGIPMELMLLLPG